MPNLGVSGNTPFSQGTNYHTARNHSFRDTSSYSVKAQMRIKCPGCGIWGLRGLNCKLCNTLIPGSASIFAKASAGRSSSPSLSHRNLSSVGGTQPSPRVGVAPRSTTPTTGTRRPVYVQRPASRTPKRNGTSIPLRRIDPNATTPKMQKMSNGNLPRGEDQGEEPSVNVQYPTADLQDERTRALAEAFGDIAPTHDAQLTQQFKIQRQDRTQALAERFGEAPRSASNHLPTDEGHLYRIDEEQREMLEVVNPHAQYAARSASAASYGKGSVRSASARSSGGVSNATGSAAPAKVKCHYCGVWVAPNRMCALCRTPN